MLLFSLEYIIFFSKLLFSFTYKKKLWFYKEIIMYSNVQTSIIYLIFGACVKFFQYGGFQHWKANVAKAKFIFHDVLHDLINYSIYTIKQFLISQE